jgi:EAL domain-containing protein (putative c-di-GMP-specific phosphodiesterase class I)
LKRRDDLAVILSMNVDLAQGFYLGRPAASPTKCLPSAKAQILQKRETSSAVRMDESRIGSFSQLATPAEADELTEAYHLSV